MATALGSQMIAQIGTGAVPSAPVSVTAAAALTSADVTDALDGATLTGTALTTSATPTVDELEANDGVLGGQYNALRADVAAILARLNAIQTQLDAMGITT